MGSNLIAPGSIAPTMDALRGHEVRLLTPRRVLRPMTESDWRTLLTWNQDPRVLVEWDSGNTVPWNLAKLQRVYRRISQHAFMFMIDFEGRAIGEGWLQEMNLPEVTARFPGRDLRRIDLSIGAPELWGRGLGSEAVGALVRFGLDQEHADAVFACDVRDTNARSRRVFEKNGFRDSGPSRHSGARHMVRTRTG